MNTMGERIKQKRKELGLSGEELGNKLGVQRAAVSKWEKGDVENIKRQLILDMSNLFDCDPAWLMGLDAPKDKTTREISAKNRLLAYAERFNVLSERNKLIFENMMDSCLSGLEESERESHG